MRGTFARNISETFFLTRTPIGLRFQIRYEHSETFRGFRIYWRTKYIHRNAAADFVSNSFKRKQRAVIRNY